MEFDALARRVQAQALAEAQRGRRVSARNAYFRAASYYRAADFFLLGRPDDPRITWIWDDARRSFDAAGMSKPSAAIESRSPMPPSLRPFVAAGVADEVNDVIEIALRHNTSLRWAVEHGCWVFAAPTPFDFLQRVRSMTLAGLIDDIRCPVLVCDADEDAFFKGQPKALADALGARATHLVFTAKNAAAEHCHVGASDPMNSAVLGWFEDAMAPAGVPPAADLRFKGPSPRTIQLTAAAAF